MISKIYTEAFGIQSYIVNGVRSSKSKVKAGLLQTMTLLDLEVYHRENRNLNRIKEFQAAVVFHSLPFDILKGSVGLFMIEVLNKSIHEEEVNENLFHFIFDKIKSLDEAEEVAPDFLLVFLIELSKQLGFFPDGKFSNITAVFDLREGMFTSSLNINPYMMEQNQSIALSGLIQNSKTEMNGAMRKSLLDSLLKYFEYHVPNFSSPKSLRVLEEVFRS